MTSLQLDILNHYYACGSIYEFENNTTRLAQAGDLVRSGLLDLVDEPKMFNITEKGTFFINHILNMPLPEAMFHIPEGGN